MSNKLTITKIDFERVCRTCLCRQDLKFLYEKCLPSPSVAEKLMACTFLKVNKKNYVIRGIINKNMLNVFEE